MIIGVDPRLSPELLMALAGMGHGDVAAIVDRNFPAGSLGPPVVRLVGCSTPEALEAVVSAIPVDIDDLPSAMLMAEPRGEVEVHAECRAVLRRAGVADEHVVGLKRHDFYDYASSAVVIVQTGEPRPYGNADSSQGRPLSRLTANGAGPPTRHARLRHPETPPGAAQRLCGGGPGSPSAPECDVSSSLWSSSHPWGLRPTTRGPKSGAHPTVAAGPHN